MASYSEESKAPWAASAANIKNIVLSEEMTSIGDYAFSECSNLEEISIPENITSVGENAFLNCDALKKINYAGTKEEWRQVNHCAIPERVEIVYGKENVKTDVIQGRYSGNVRRKNNLFAIKLVCEHFCWGQQQPR